MTIRAHGTCARYVWGPDENDEPGRGCHCQPCRDARRKVENHRSRMILYGRWQPYVDAGPARGHVRALAACGIGWKRAALLAGVPNGTMSKLLFGGPGDRPPSRRVRPETERRILAVRPSLETLGGAAPVDATATRRRVEALAAVGYSRASIAARLGRSVQNFLTTLGREHVTAATARAVQALYDELWDVPPDESAHRARISASRARNMARVRGWPPPMAWDDETIGDPAASPAEGWQRGRLSGAEVAEEARELLALGDTREHAALRLGMSRSTLDTVLARAARKAS